MTLDNLVALDLDELLLVHALHVPTNVHLLLGTVHTERTLELRILAALPFQVVAQRRLEFVHATAFGTRKSVQRATEVVDRMVVAWGAGAAAAKLQVMVLVR